MGQRRLIDPDRDLLSPAEVATAMGLANADALSATIPRHPDFPEPWINKGRFLRLWLRKDIENFLARNPRMGRKARDPKADPS